MGKKRVAKKGVDELLKETDAVDGGVAQEIGKSRTSQRAREGRVHIHSSYNNTIITLTDPRGNAIAQISAGRIGFKGTKKSTPYAASRVADAIASIIANQGIGQIEIFIKGIGPGRDSALRSLSTKGVEIVAIRDITPIPHNGPKPPRPRRV